MINIDETDKTIRGVDKMTKIHKFANVNGLQVMLRPGNMSVEPMLLFKENEELIEMTLDSNIHENGLGEFMFHEGLHGEQKENAETIMNELADNIREIGHFRIFTLKDKHKEQLMKIIDELVETKEYYNI